MTRPSARSTEPTARPWHALDASSALAALRSDATEGLARADARERLATHGPNVLPRAQGPSPLRLLLRQLDDPIVYLLLGAAVLAVFLGKALDGAVVLAAVVLNAAIGFVQELRAGKAIEALSRLVPHDAQVVREGRTESVPSADLVPGDIVFLASGDRVPGDVRLLATKGLRIEEAALTGESIAAEKSSAPVPEETSLGDRRCMGFSGTVVTAGTGRALVVATGDATELGRISHLLEDATELQTPLTRALASVGRWLTLAVLVISGVLFGVSVARGYSLGEGVLVAIALAVATIPEGLPAIITITLAIGVQRLAAKSAVIRKLASVETLGSTTVICSDKTGTLTRNEMTVQAIDAPSGTYTVSGIGYSPTGSLSSSTGTLAETPADLRLLLQAAALCSDASVHVESGVWKLSGDPTEAALVVAAMKAGVDVGALRRAWPRIDVVPFESEHQFMATLHAAPREGGRVVFIKGAPEAVLRRCALDDAAREEIASRVARLAGRGMRVLAVAQRHVATSTDVLAREDVEDGFSLLGLEGMIDPPRPEAIEAIRACHRAGITVKMITGDHLATAEAIGRQLGLTSEHDRGVIGTELARMDDAALARAVKTTHVFARVAPEHKLRLVRALQADGHVVAMTGDGVNDAPSLKQADVGVAMGITGSAVTKEAADVVLADDNFASIAAAVEEGRRIYDNLTKSLAFVLPTNLGLGFILIASAAFFPVLTIAGESVPLMPANPTQLLWVNLVASVALSLPLAFEVREPDTMTRPPRAPKSPILDRFIVARTLLVALLMAGGAVGLFLWEYWTEVPLRGHVIALREAQTMAVTTVVFFQIFYLFNCRSLRASVLQVGLFTNRTVFAGIAALLLLQAAFIYAPFMQTVFGTASLAPKALGLSALVAAVVLPIIGLEKTIRNRSAARRDRPLRVAPARGISQS